MGVSWCIGTPRSTAAPPPLGPNPAGGPRSDPLEVLFPVLYAEMGTLLPLSRSWAARMTNSSVRSQATVFGTDGC